MKKIIIINFFIILIIGFVFEIVLHKTNRYNHLISNNLISSNRIWENMPNSKMKYLHTDLGYDVINTYRKYGAKYSNLIYEKDRKIWAFFGDSFQDNRRIEENYHYNSIIEKLDKNIAAINFGVDGYGIDQSYLSYLEMRKKFKFNKVFYLFCENDLIDLGYTNLIQLSDNGSLYFQNINQNLKSKLFHYIGKLRITYFALEVYQIIRGKNSDPEYIQSQYKRNFIIEKKQTTNYAKKLDKAHLMWNSFINELEQNKNKKNSLSKKNLKYIKKFNLILKTWKNQVEKENANFYVIVLPSKKNLINVFDNVIDKKVEYNVIYLQNKIKNYWLKDGHWNEYGNLSAATDVLEYFNLNYDKKLIQSREGIIDNLYLHKLKK